MTKELKDYSIDELYNELKSRDHVAIVMWVDEDIVEALSYEEVKHTDRNIQAVWDRLGDWLEDDSIERGWEILADAINDCHFKD